MMQGYHKENDMATIYIYTLGRLRGAMLGWGIGLALFGGYMLRFFDTLAEQGEALTQLMAQYPQELLVFFGDMSQMFTPAGYMHIEFFSYMPLILGIFIASMAGGLLAGDEEKGTLDLILSHPISRSRLFAGRVGALITAVLGILFTIWLAFIIAVQGTLLDEISVGEMALPLLSLAGLLTFFGALAVLLSLLLPSQRAATMVTSLILFGSFFLSGMASIDENLETLEIYSPFHYYQGGYALNGMDWGWLGVLAGTAGLMIFLAWWRFERRDIRVAGEGGWRWSLRSRRRSATAE
jgi:ABC-2 type transport system permease protein